MVCDDEERVQFCKEGGQKKKKKDKEMGSAQRKIPMSIQREY